MTHIFEICATALANLQVIHHAADSVGAFEPLLPIVVIHGHVPMG